MPSSLPFYHVCLVVDDIERALTSLTASLGLTRTTIHVAAICVDNGDHQIETTVRYAYSVRGPHSWSCWNGVPVRHGHKLACITSECGVRSSASFPSGSSR
jgi:hypothetical protein